MKNPWWWTLLLVSGCTLVTDKDWNSFDADGDASFVDASGQGEDCDDHDSAVHPGAAETCNEKDDNCDGQVDEGVLSTFYLDTDGDGYGDPERPVDACDLTEGIVEDGTDCDDDDPSIFPGAIESCDDIDNDCDKTTDEGLETTDWYQDLDGDGYGRADVFETDCAQPKGFVATPGDCDDSREDVHPDAEELCNAIDDDCDKLTDDDDPDVTGRSTWFHDADGDGFGDPKEAILACEAPYDFVVDDTDCDDGRAASNPSASEYCNGEDDDCDGTTDENDALDASVWWPDGDGDGYGVSMGGVGSCVCPSGFAASDSDCDDSNGEIHPDAYERCNGVDDDCDGVEDEPTALDASTWYFDGDGDTYGTPDVTSRACSQPSDFVSTSTDCNDSDPGAHPGAAEYCDGHDDDCDSEVDESSAVDALTWYRDGDDDGFGNAASTSSGCVAPTGYVADSTDCDDTWSIVHPGATEIWYDGIDENCDGESDYDADGDSYISDSHGGDDCDDADPARYPGSTTWTVPGDFSSIQDAIDAACTLDRIEVSAGTYVENLVFGTKAVEVVGVEGAGGTFLDGDENGRSTVTIGVGTLSGFTITRGLATNGGGVFVEAAGPVFLDHLVIMGNAASSNGGGVYVSASAIVEMSNCDVIANVTGGSGGGAYFDASVVIRDSSFDFNSLVSEDSGHAAGLLLQRGGDLFNVNVRDNTAWNLAGAEVYDVEWVGGTVSGNTCSSNSAGVYIRGGSLSDLVISDNSGSYAIEAYGTTHLDGVVVRDNVATTATVWFESSGDMVDVVVSGNSRGYYGTLVFESDGFTASRVAVLNNLGAVYGAAVKISRSGEIDSMLVSGNESDGLLIVPESSSDRIGITNVSAVGNLGSGFLVSPNWVSQITVNNMISSYNGTYGIDDTSSTFRPVITYSDVYGNGSGAYRGFPDPSGTSGNVSLAPDFVAFSSGGDAELWDLHLAATSPLINAGDPTLTDDDGTRSDIGAYSGTGW